MEEVTRLGPILKEDEPLFGVAHIYAGFNDTFVVSSRRAPGQRSASPARRCPRPRPCRPPSVPRQPRLV